MNEAPGPGRPLDRSRDDAILAATVEIFDEVGWDGLTVAEVATRAHVGLSTIYRRWSSKSELVAAALAGTLDTGRSAATTTSAVEEVLTVLRESLVGPRAAYFPGLLAAMRADPATAEAIRRAAIDPDRERLCAEVALRLGPAAERVTVELIADIAPAVLVYRTIVLGDDLPSEIIEGLASVIETVIASVAQ